MKHLWWGLSDTLICRCSNMSLGVFLFVTMFIYQNISSRFSPRAPELHNLRVLASLTLLSVVSISRNGPEIWFSKSGWLLLYVRASIALVGLSCRQVAVVAPRIRSWMTLMITHLLWWHELWILVQNYKYQPVGVNLPVEYQLDFSMFSVISMYCL